MSSEAARTAAGPAPLPWPEPLTEPWPAAGPLTAHGAGFPPGSPGQDGDPPPAAEDMLVPDPISPCAPDGAVAWLTPLACGTLVTPPLPGGVE
jgi:hypothetical protein